MIFHCKIRPAILKLGFNGVGTIHPFRDKTIINIDKGGELHVYDSVNIGCGSNIAVAKNAKLIFLGNNDITARSTFITHKKIQIGVNSVISWDCLFMDTDFHNVLHHSEIMNPDKEITIGNNCWIGCRCTILKGFILPDNCVLGANSVGTKNLCYENSLYAGNPATLKKNNITWNG